MKKISITKLPYRCNLRQLKLLVYNTEIKAYSPYDLAPVMRSNSMFQK